MRLAATLVSFIVILVGVYFNQKKSQTLITEPETQKDVKIGEEESVLSIKEDGKQDEIEESVSTKFEQTPSFTPTPKSSLSYSLSEYIYPNAELIKQESLSLELKSSDSSDEITDWYKEKITNEEMVVKTFVKTKTNGNVLNELVGINSSREVRVKITKPKEEDITSILVSISD